MRINKGYWLWGLFPSKETNILNEIKVKVQSKLKSPFFETHITLAGPYLSIDKPFLNKLKTFGESNSVIMLNVEGYDFKQKKYESFYISIKKSRPLNEIRKNIYELNKFDVGNNYSPHISLSYGNHEIKEKKILISKLPKFNKPIKMSKIALVQVDEDIHLWKILESFDLN
ncbi:Hypothetical protein P9515_12811 [Prochlorococcus marinus str. MIT 9515]|uniref:Uncharacterized protein n=1 Tax=Prochlorococcus marinus (strain MIT 9515) TaxID=167542 RepID=A2BXH7_PROM5|nr:2'-5' RNA ligase family protein [Prochlorococcus marinus]ABM72488.1 Hypothetical protein P9515_12811 [Prochlorococcus marinus str. MIT 9515]